MEVKAPGCIHRSDSGPLLEELDQFTRTGETHTTETYSSQFWRLAAKAKASVGLVSPEASLLG
jgi:hypothetical protein